jgi:hypothetical protein
MHRILCSDIHLVLLDSAQRLPSTLQTANKVPLPYPFNDITSLPAFPSTDSSMDSVISRSTPELLPAIRATRMVLVGAGQGVHLIATCLLNVQTSQMSISEIYEWLAEKYPHYQYTKSKIRHVLSHDSERKSPRFVIANNYRIAGVPLR